MTAKTDLIVFPDSFTDDQHGYNEAWDVTEVFAVQLIDQTYSSMINVQAVATAAGECDSLGSSIRIGLLQRGQYIPLHVVHDSKGTDLKLLAYKNRNLDYENLDQAFHIGVANLATKAKNTDLLRKKLDVALGKLYDDLICSEEKSALGNYIRVRETGSKP